MDTSNEVPVVQAAPVAANGEPVPARDHSNDGILAKFVVCIVELPFVIIGITLSISLIIASFTLHEVFYVYGTDRWFAQGASGSEDIAHITSLAFDGIQYAFDSSCPDDPTVSPCGSERQSGASGF
eukprot:COSAG06_NODE_41188_length_394_cov_0.579661_1_plen_125_part_10